MESDASNKIKVILFATIKEIAGWDERFFTIKVNEIKVYEIWKLINCKLPKESIIVALNKEITDMDSFIQPGDELAFMPIFTGG